MLEWNRTRSTALIVASLASAACALPHASLRQDTSVGDASRPDMGLADGPDATLDDVTDDRQSPPDAIDDRPSPPPDVPCPSGQMNCGGRCIDTASDPNNCGGCAMTCPTGASCSTGVCGCPMGQTACMNRCVNTQSDNMNCGVCGRSCGAGQLCVGGVCGATCTAPMTMCGPTCTNTQTDAMNCGTCGMACPTGDSCVAGRCTLVCTAPTVPCGGRCVNTMTDSSHCGMCGRACASPMTCAAGACACPMGTTSCSAICVDATRDPNNCGACGTMCRADQTCSMGRCVCAAGRAECSGACVDTATSPTNCGACGFACRGPDGGTALTCSGGMCGGGTCPAGTHLCVGSCLSNDSVASCGTRCTACLPVLNATPTCTGGMCGFACNPGWVRNATDTGCTQCGNGAIDGAETCDDGNRVPDDGCNVACFTEVGAFVEACADTPTTIPIRRGQTIVIQDSSGANNDGTGPGGCNADGREVVASVMAVDTGTLTITATPILPIDNWDLVLRYGIGACPGDTCTNAGGGPRRAESAMVPIGTMNTRVAVVVDGNAGGDNGTFRLELTLR
ncbi:MAG: DUF4215 domain-containing protein [Myxococcales bacterium]|nr:DUF4215 domain-containing protein [Myxococcales bacterium]